MTDKIYTLDELKSIVIPIAKQHRVTKMYLFGSYAKGTADEKSDIDIRIDSKNLRNLFALGGLYADLEEALNKPLDLVTTESLRTNKSEPLTRRLIRNIKQCEILLSEEMSA